MVKEKKETSLLGVRCPNTLIKRLDVVADQLNINRSSLVNMILSEYLNQKLREDNSPKSPK